MNAWISYFILVNLCFGEYPLAMLRPQPFARETVEMSNRIASNSVMVSP